MVKEGDILWRMVGVSKESKTIWSPVSFEVVSINKKGHYKLNDGSSGSQNNIGKNVYLTEKEAVQRFFETHDSLTTENVNDQRCSDCSFYAYKGVGTRVNALGQRERFYIMDCLVEKCRKEVR